MAGRPWHKRSIGDLWSAGWSTIGGFFGIGGYSATDPRRKILPSGMRPTSATANELLTASLPGLRAYCRHLERNNPTARAAVEGLVANVVGTGIALEPDTGNETTDKRIRAEWTAFIRDCAVNGHDLYYLQGQAFREVVTAGEFVWRLAVLTERIESGKLPLAVLTLESEWLDDTYQTSGQPDADGITWVGGVGVDKYGIPKFYRLRRPGMGTVGEPETISVKEIIHEFERRRSLQARGEPWFAPVIETMQQERDLVDAELKAAVNCSAMALVITSELQEDLDTTEDGTTDDPAQTIRIGGTARISPGEDVKAFSHDRPSQQIAPFRQMLRGDIAASLRIPQRFLDRDVSRANYSSLRADMLDSDRLLAPVREWFGHATAGRLYQAALPYLAIKAGVPLPRANYHLLPDGQPYVDPYKDIQGAAMGVAAGFTTWQAEIAKRGGDYRALWAQAARERAELNKLGLNFDLSGTNAPAPDSTIGVPAEAPKPAAKGATDGEQ